MVSPGKLKKRQHIRKNDFHFHNRHRPSNACMRACDKRQHGVGRMVVCRKVQPSSRVEPVFSSVFSRTRKKWHRLFSIFTPNFLPGVHNANLGEMTSRASPIKGVGYHLQGSGCRFLWGRARRRCTPFELLDELSLGQGASLAGFPF